MAEIKGSSEVCNHCNKNIETIIRRIYGYTDESWNYDPVDKSYEHSRYEDEFESNGVYIYYCGHCGKELSKELQDKIEIILFQ